MSKRKLFNSKARERASRLTRKAVCYVMTAVMAASTLLGASVPAAYADSTAYLSATYRISYGGAHTTKFDVDGNEGYCANPSKPTPSSSTVSRIPAPRSSTNVSTLSSIPFAARIPPRR